MAAWFLGPKAENRVEFNNLVLSVLNDYEDYRASYQPTDPLYISEDVKYSEAYQHEIQNLRDCLKGLNASLRDSVPFFSSRYKVRTIDYINLLKHTLTSFFLVGYVEERLWWPVQSPNIGGKKKASS